MARMDLAWGYPRNGCHARAHLMATAMQQRGLQPGKVWAFADDPQHMLTIPDASVPLGVIEFGFHVAPTVKVQNIAGAVETVVVDPMLHHEPLTIAHWLQALQGQSAQVIETVLGQPPIPQLG